MKKQITLLVVLALLFASCKQTKDLYSTYYHFKVLDVKKKDKQKFFSTIEDDTTIFKKVISIDADSRVETKWKKTTYIVPLYDKVKDENGKKEIIQTGDITCTAIVSSDLISFGWELKGDEYPIKQMTLDKSGYLMQIKTYNHQNMEGPYFNAYAKSESEKENLKYYQRLPYDIDVGKQLVGVLYNEVMQ